MNSTLRHWRLWMLAGTAFAPAIAHAQGAPTTGAGGTSATPSAAAAPASAAPGASVQEEQAPEEAVEISTPGGGASGGASGDIVVRGRNIPAPVRASSEVISVLSTAEIARTGEGDIAGALTRVTGLSVVGNGFVYVRGLGDRYSSALLNGLPLPSPEPLKRVVPLDIFPTSVIASAVVQKSYSPNFPGEFGGGVINLTTPAVPREAFFNVGVSGSIDTETTGKLGYTYEGSDLDFLGFDNGARDMPDGLKNAIAGIQSGTPLATLPTPALQGIAASLRNAETTLLQRNRDIPGNFSADFNAGNSWDVGSDARLGVIASASYSSTWRTRFATQQTANDPDLASLQVDQRTVITDNRVVLSGLLGFGLDIGDHKLRFTNLYIRDVVKQGRLAAGYNASVSGAEPVASPDFFNNVPVLTQNTYWFERQLIDTQGVAELRFGDLSVDVRGGYANSQRESPYERTFSYTYSAAVNDYVNAVRNQQGQQASVAFSDLNEDVYAGGIDLGYKLPTDRDVKLTAGYAYTKTTRDASRYLFGYLSTGGLPALATQERPDFLVSDYNIYNYSIILQDQSSAEGAAAYSAGLRVQAGYGQADVELVDGLRLSGGVRYEDARQTVSPLIASGVNATRTQLANDYWLPAATLTWTFAQTMQLRLAASKTIARPQFRELARQIYQDFESDRTFIGNPLLTDSKLKNAEARVEYYPSRGERLSLAGFFKRIDNPVEQVAFLVGGGGIRTSFSNATSADLYGGEVEVVKYIPLESLGGDLFATRRVLVSANYTYTKSKIKAGDELVVDPSGLQRVAADTLFRHGAPLTGQSDHIANLQFGLEDSDHLSQQTILLNYASKRVTNRGPIQGGRQPDILENPGLRLDFVAREEVDFLGRTFELKFEARNITGRSYQEYQKVGDRRIEVNSYDLGTTLSLGATMKL